MQGSYSDQFIYTNNNNLLSVHGESIFMFTLKSGKTNRANGIMRTGNCDIYDEGYPLSTV